MAQQSKRTCALMPKALAIPASGDQPVPLSAMFGTVVWCPPRAPWPMSPSSSPYWLAGLQHSNMAGLAAQGPWWGPPGIGASANHAPSSDNLEDSNLQAWYASTLARVVDENAPDPLPRCPLCLSMS
ncbi:hypothetical protein ABZP36_006403 [Zizania latifolia]